MWLNYVARCLHVNNEPLQCRAEAIRHELIYSKGYQASRHDTTHLSPFTLLLVSCKDQQLRSCYEGLTMNCASNPSFLVVHFHDSHKGFLRNVNPSHGLESLLPLFLSV